MTPQQPDHQRGTVHLRPHVDLTELEPADRRRVVFGLEHLLGPGGSVEIVVGPQGPHDTPDLVRVLTQLVAVGVHIDLVGSADVLPAWSTAIRDAAKPWRPELRIVR